jgi:hypothetical protein
LDDLWPNYTLVGRNAIQSVWMAESAIEWTQKWKAEGLQEGRQEGKAELLQTLLESRFGSLPDWALIRLKESTTAEIERWCLRVLNQSSLQEVLN